MADNEHTDERNGVSRANEQVIRAIVRDELRGGEAGERDGGVTRREVLEAAGLVGVGALGGTTAMNEMVGTAEAATGTGNLGTAENPLDTLYTNNLGDASEPVQNAEVQSLASQSVHTDDLNNDLWANSLTDAEVQAQVDALPATGGKVRLQRGTYVFDNQVDITGVDNLTIEGAGTSTLIKAGSGVSNLFYGEDVEFPTFRKLSFDGQRATESTVGINLTDGAGKGAVSAKIQNCEFTGFALAPVFIDGPKMDEYGRGHEVSGCTFRDTPNRPAIQLNNLNPEYTRIVNNQAYECLYLAKLRAGNVTVEANTATFCDSGVFITDENSEPNAGKTLVNGNTFNHMDWHGVKMEATDSTAIESTQIIGNTFKAIAKHGMYLDGIGNALIEDNDFWGVGSDADLSFDAIHLRSTNATTTDNVIQNNYLQSYFNTNNVNYGVNESDTGTSGNVVKNNVTKAANGYNLNTASTPATIASGNETL